MKKMKCSKYPTDKCKNYENRAYEKCELCIYNLYQDVNCLKDTKDYFEKI